MKAPSKKAKLSQNVKSKINKSKQIQLNSTELPSFIKSHIKNVLQEFSFNSNPNNKPGISEQEIDEI